MYLSSATNGSQGLKKKMVNLLTIVLFEAGMLAAAVFAYQQLTTSAKPFPVWKDEAIRIALLEVDKEPRRYPDYLPNEKATKEAKTELIHVTDNGLSFVVDEESLADMWLYSAEGTPLNEYDDKYFCEVRVTTSTELGERGYWYWIDADNGQVLGQSGY